MDNLDITRIESLLTNKPYKRYIKVTISRVSVKILDPISLRETEVILSGDPQNKPDSAILNVWTPAEDVYLRRNNKNIFNEGLILEYNEDIDSALNANSVSDEELREALTGKFFAIKALLDKFTSPAPAQRMLAMAEELDRPVRTIDAIKSKLADLQAKEYENIGLLTTNLNEGITND